MHNSRSKSTHDMPENRKGHSSHWPSTGWPGAAVGFGNENTSLKTREWDVKVDLKTLKRVFSTYA